MRCARHGNAAKNTSADTARTAGTVLGTAARWDRQRIHGGAVAAGVGVERIGGDPAGHQNHRHPRPGMRCAAGEIQTRQVARAIARLECAEKPAVAREPVNGAIEYAVALMNVLRRQVSLEHDPPFQIRHARRPRQLVQDHATVWGQHGRPVVVRPDIGRMHENVQRLAARRRHVRARCAPGRRYRRSGRAPVRPCDRSSRTPLPDRGKTRSCGAPDARRRDRGRDIEPPPSRPAPVSSVLQNLFARRPADQLAIGPHAVHVRDDVIETHDFSGLGLDAAGAVVLAQHPPHAAADPKLNAEIGRQRRQSFRHGAGAADRYQMPSCVCM